MQHVEWRLRPPSTWDGGGWPPAFLAVAGIINLAPALCDELCFATYSDETSFVNSGASLRIGASQRQALSFVSIQKARNISVFVAAACHHLDFVSQARAQRPNCEVQNSRP
jgi:hypothetical protein